MISNEEQYARTKRWAELFEEAAQMVGPAADARFAVIVAAQRAALESQAQDLREELAEYERRKAQP